MRRLLVGLVVLAGLTAATAHGERVQRGDVIVFLDGELSPLALPRERPAPVSVRIEAGLQAVGGSELPRVTRIELGLPGQAVVTTRGLPVCAARRLRDTTPAGAMEACGPAIVGRGSLRAEVALPNQKPFPLKAKVLAFNGRVEGKRAVLVHILSARPLGSADLAFVFQRGEGRFGTALVANPRSSLGPWPRLERFEMTFGRRYTDRGRSLSYLNASCPAPKNGTAGFLSLARVSFRLDDGRRVSTGIARSCRAR